MAFYDYRCEGCGENFTARRAVADRAGASCPKCSTIAPMIFSPTGSFYIPLSEHPARRSGDEIMVGAYHHGQKFRDKYDPNEPIRAEAMADVEGRVVRDDAIRDAARSEFDQSYDYLSGPKRAEARETMEADLDRKGVRR